MITSKQVEALAHSNRIHFYEVLAHNLTVVVREIWSDERLTNAEKVDQLREVNEILHPCHRQNLGCETRRRSI